MPTTATAPDLGTTRKPVVDQIFGDNKAPVEEVLQADFAEMMEAIAELLVEAGDLPSKVNSDDDQAAVGRWIVKARAYAKRADEVRQSENKPVLAAQRGINAFFAQIVEPIDHAVKKAQSLADDFVRRKEAEARARAQREAEEARKKAQEAEERAAKAKSAGAAGNAEGRAEAYHAAAEAAEERALAAANDLTRHRAEGVTSSARTQWTWEFTDKNAAYATLGPLGNFMAEADVAKAINAMVRAQKGRAKLDGIRVFEKSVASFRG
jgi:hypothetical protein